MNMVKKNVKEYFVTFGVKKNGRYYSKEEMTLDEFEGFLKQNVYDVSFIEIPRWSWIKKKIGLTQEKLAIEKGQAVTTAHFAYIDDAIKRIKKVMDYDGPGKKVLKKK